MMLPRQSGNPPLTTLRSLGSPCLQLPLPTPCGGKPIFTDPLFCFSLIFALPKKPWRTEPCRTCSWQESLDLGPAAEVGRAVLAVAAMHHLPLVGSSLERGSGFVMHSTPLQAAAASVVLKSMHARLARRLAMGFASAGRMPSPLPPLNTDHHTPPPPPPAAGNGNCGRNRGRRNR